MNNKSLQAVFFDFDGVIIDSTRTKTEAFRRLFCDYDSHTVDRIIRFHQENGGISRVVKIDHAHRNIIGTPLADEELTRWASAYRELVIDKMVTVDWIAGALASLDRLVGRVPVFVISGTPEGELAEIIERRNISNYFREILGSPTRKPVHIHYLLDRYALQPKRCVFVGDALTDYRAARETGLHFIGIEGELPFPAGTPVLPDCTGLLQAVKAYLPESKF